MKSSLGFDPREIPWTPPAGEWPALPADWLTADRIKQAFVNPPAWTPEVKREPAFGQRPPKDAAVLFPIVLRGEQGTQAHVLLTQRTMHLSTHAGQIAFPGGKVDAEDMSIKDAALREAQEEVGLAAHFVDVVGCMPSYITGTAFHITPVIGLVSPHHVVTPNAFEVEAVFEVPLHFLMDPANHRLHQMERDGMLRQWYSMPYLEPHASKDGTYTERFIWGATAGMIRNFYRFLLAANSL